MKEFKPGRLTKVDKLPSTKSKNKSTTLYIRNFPAELFRALKVRAAETGKTLKDLCVEILKREVGNNETNKSNKY